VLDEVSEQHGPVVRLGAGPMMRVAIVGDPVAIADLFAECPESFRWNHRFNVLTLWAGRGSMINSDGADHRRLRDAVQVGFSRRRLNGWIPMILDSADTTIDHLVGSLDEPPRTVDMDPVGRSLLLGIVVRALCGPRLAQRAREIGDLMQRAQDYFEGPAIRQIPHPFPLGRRHRVRRDRQAFDKIIDDEIARLRTAPDGDENNVLETLVTTGELTDSEIRDQIATLLGAGYDSTSATLAWLLLRATAVPGLWDRLATEADRVFSTISDGRDPDHTMLAGLALADRTVRETLRLHPPAGFGVRETVTDVTAGGYLIPRHTLIAWSPYLSGRDARYWPDPLHFEPDRHLNPTPEQSALAKAAWVPFGGGARNCIGFALAQMELTLIVARFAQRLQLTPVTTAVPLANRRSRPRGGAPLQVTPR